jgi:NAD-dependent dihydropyrimidine dehydrogenase PreA subunit
MGEWAMPLDPDAMARSNYYAVIDRDDCNVCEICAERCQVDAIRQSRE